VPRAGGELLSCCRVCGVESFGNWLITLAGSMKPGRARAPSALWDPSLPQQHIELALCPDRQQRQSRESEIPALCMPSADSQLMGSQTIAPRVALLPQAECDGFDENVITALTNIA
jgi:hypothetical protein